MFSTTYMYKWRYQMCVHVD